MKYINVGAEGPKGNFPTKKALGAQLAKDPSSVYIYGTSFFEPYEGHAHTLPEGIRFSVVGPDPQTNRKWYATIENKNGKLLFS